MLSTSEYAAARDEIDALMERFQTARKGIRLAESHQEAPPYVVEWAVVYDEGGKVLNLTLLFHSKNPREVVAFLRGLLTEVPDAAE